MNIIYAIPGLGTTEALFCNIAVKGFKIKVLKWPEPKKHISLKEYAMIFKDQIDNSLPVNLIGVSFGGMICVELAATMPTNKVVLISSCKNSSELPLLFQVLKRLPVYKVLSDKLLRSLAKKNYKVLGFESSFRNEFEKMVDHMTKNYFSQCMDYIFGWNNIQTSIPLIHIHGTSDRVIPSNRIKNFIPVKNGSHAMVVDRAEEINQLLNKQFNGL